MSRIEIAIFALLVVVAVLCSASLAADPPSWKKGDTWTVRTLQREVALIPPGPKGPRLPGAPPRRAGVPEGWKHANRWRLTVDRVEDGVTVVVLESLEGDEKRRKELGFKAGKLVRVGGRMLGDKTTGLREARELGFPLDWPEKFDDWKEGACWWRTFECSGLRGELE
ncbi:MAG: hypothetical protein ACAI25_17600 [Planctomycetota bacterium]